MGIKYSHDLHLIILFIQAFVSAHDWRQAFCMAARLEYSSNRISELAVKLASKSDGYLAGFLTGKYFIRPNCL